MDKCQMMMTSQVSCQGHGQPSVISVSSSLPLGTPPVPIRALWELFNGCARFGNQTRWRSEYSDKSRRTVNAVDRAVVFIARTMPCHRTRASFTHLSEIQIHQTNINLKGETVCPDWNRLWNWENSMWYMFLWNTQCTKIQKDWYRNDKNRPKSNPKKIYFCRKP